MAQTGQGQGLLVAGTLILVRLLVNVELSATGRHGTRVLGVNHATAGAVVQVEHTVVGGDRRAIAQTIHTCVLGAVAQLKAAGIDRDRGGLADRAAGALIAAAERKGAGIDRGRSGVGAGAADAELVAAVLGQAAGSAEDAGDIGLLVDRADREQITRVIHIAENLHARAVGVVARPSLRRTQNHAGVDEHSQIIRDRRSSQGQAAAADGQLVTRVEDRHVIVDHRRGEALDGQVGPHRQVVVGGHVADAVEEEVRAGAGN